MVVDAPVLVLRKVARVDLLFPARLVALGPVVAAVGQRGVAPGLGVGLALVLALLVHDDLLGFPATGEPQAPPRR